MKNRKFYQINRSYQKEPSENYRTERYNKRNKNLLDGVEMTAQNQ